MKTFTNCAEKKAKQILNLLQGYTKGIRITAILILLLMGVSNAWADYTWYSGDLLYYDFSAVSGGVNWHDGSTMQYDGSGGGKVKKVEFSNQVTMKNDWVVAKTNNGSWSDIKFSNPPSANQRRFIINSDGKTASWGYLDKYIAGDNWGGIGSWSTTTKKMTNNNNGTYTINFTSITASAHEFKIVNYDTWTGAIGHSNNVSCVNGKLENSGGNIKFTPYIEGNVTITHNVSTGKTIITCSGIPVTLNQQSGTGGTTSVTATYGAAMPTATMPTRTGYTFNGYFTATSGGTKYYNADGSSAKNWDKTTATTLYAQWTINSHKVTWKANGGNWSGSTADKVVTYNYGATIAEQAAPTRVGYEFAGWSPAFVANTTMPDNDLTYTAQWTENTYTVTINNDGHGTTTPSGAQSNVRQVTGIEISATANNGYEFENWTITSGSGSFTSTTATTTTFKPTAASTIQANFSIINYNITYNNLNGVTHANPETYNIETPTITFTNPTSERTGYTFNGWSPASIAQGSTGNKTVSAQWTAKTYTVTLNQEEATTSGTTSVTATYGSAMPAITKPTRTGYTFGGYWTEKEGQGTQYYKADGTSAKDWDQTSNITLYAQWTIKQYTITYGVVGGAHGTIQLNSGDYVTTSSSATANYNTSHTFTAAPANDYKIEGWYSDANGANKIDAAGKYNTYEIAPLIADTYVYVKFVETAEVMSQVNVTATEGGTVSPSGTVEVGNRTPTTFTATPASGYRFGSWDIEGDIVAPQDLTNPTISITANGSGTLTANFVRVHTVNFFATPAAAGTATATVNGNAITSGDKLDVNTSVTFTAAVANAYNGQCTFVRWVDGAGTPLSNNATYTHTVKEDITVKAIFKITQYTLTFSASDGGFVSAKANNSAIASPANLDYNTSVTLTAEPDAGCAFVKWVNENETQLSTSPTYTFNLTAAKTVKAVFAQGTTVYLKPVDWWKNDKARFAVYMWNNSENKWIEMEDLGCNGDIYTANIPSKYTSFMFVRLKPVTHAEYNTENGGYNFANAWNQTEDLTIPTGNKNTYDMNAESITNLYLKPHDNWKSDNARFAAYFFVNSSKKWVSMTHLKDGIYKCQIPTDNAYTTVIYGRMNPQGTNGWTQDTQIWNQTGDLTIPTNGTNCYTLTGGEWSNVTGEWSTIYDDSKWTTYSAPSYKIKINTPTNGTIAVTKADGSAVATNTSLALGTEIKIVFTPNSGHELINYFIEYATATDKADTYTVCGPTEITAEFEPETPSRTVYLRPNDDWMKDNPVFAARVRKSSGGNDKWYVMHTTSEDYTGAYSCNIPNDYDKLIFVRLNPKGSDPENDGFNWTNAWNQTKELTIIDKDNDKTNDHKLRFAIGDKIVGGNDNDRYDGKWEENTPIWGMIANFNDWKAEKAVFKGYPGHLDVMPPFGTSHEFKLYNFVYENNKYLGNAGTMKRANSGQWWTMDASEQADCKMMLDVKGDYIYQMRFLTVGSELRKQISVTYPEANMYYLMYEEETDEGVKQRISYGIGIKGEECLDTVSFFVDITKSAKIYILDGNQTKVGDPYTIIGTIGQNPTGAQAPQRQAEDNPELLIEEGCGITESGVYNFVAQQDANKNVTLLINDWHAYTGAYYIRTDAASGGWGGYKQNGNKMTYTSYADKNHNFDHYYCKWVESSQSSYANVKFCVANDYSHKLSDELDGDEIIEKALVPTGCLPEDANVRFGWDSKTNELSRAYISGSAKAVDRFLVLTGNEYLLDIEGNAFPNGIGDRTGLKANEEIFDDMGNWVYQLDVRANKQTAIKLTANFNNKVQTFFGDARAAEGVALVMDATSDEYYKVRMIYNFKTNHLLAAWLLDREQEINKGEITSNVLIIREDHGEANQLQFNNSLTKMTINTAYAAMTFTKDHVTDTEKSQWQRYEYWVSFPFDVKISDVFGFGEYGTEWIMQLYDGAERAEKGNWIDSPTFWKYITNRNYTLQAGVGYVLKLQASKMTDENAFKYSDKVSLYFPSIPNEDGNTIISATPDTQHEIPEHECTIERDDRNIYDSHWNLIGVPGYANIANFNTDASLSPVEYKNGEVSFYYAYNAADNTYQATSATSNFKNMHSYMVQFAGTINWSTPETPTQLAARHNSDTEPEKRTLRLEIAQGEEVADRTFVQMQQEGATANFDLSLDLTKIVNIGVSNIYTLTDSLKIQTAGNVLPFEETTVAVGVDIATAGEYTFRMPNGTEGMVVELIDYETNTRTNLLLSDYTVNLPAGTCETRFALSVKIDKTATSVENITEVEGANGEGVKKYIIDGKLFLQKDGMLYDAQGHIVR